jgi:HPt (histidine-containing phosphotransfer) domain-containing protein
MDPTFEGLEEYGIDIEVGIEYTGNRDKYISAIERFCKSYESSRQRITETLEARNTDDYTIAVHSLKSNSRMIGAGTLAGRFEALELAARAGNMSVLVNDTEDVLESYSLLVDRLRKLVTGQEAVNVDEIDIETAEEITDELLEALDEFDDERSAALAARLSGYPFDEEQKDMLEKASGYIGEFLYDEAAELIKEIALTIR